MSAGMYSDQFQSPFSPEQEAKMLAFLRRNADKIVSLPLFHGHGRVARIGTPERPPTETFESVYFRTAPFSLAAMGPCPETAAEALKAAPLRSVLPDGFEAEAAK